MNRTDIHKAICEVLHDTYVRKNANYGNSFVNTRSEVKNAIIVRLMDKMERLKQLMKGDEDLVGESIDDTLLDLANYAILELIERKIDREKESGKLTQAYKITYAIDEHGNCEFEAFDTVKEVEKFIIDSNWDTTKYFELISIEELK